MLNEYRNDCISTQMSNIFFICIETFKNGIIIKVLYILLGVNYEHNMCWWTFLFFKSQDWKSANRCFLFGNYFPDVSSLIAASLTAGGTKYLKEKRSWSWFPVWILKIVCMLCFFQRISLYLYIFILYLKKAHYSFAMSVLGFVNISGDFS